MCCSSILRPASSPILGVYSPLSYTIKFEVMFTTILDCYRTGARHGYWYARVVQRTGACYVWCHLLFVPRGSQWGLASWSWTGSETLISWWQQHSWSDIWLHPACKWHDTVCSILNHVFRIVVCILLLLSPHQLNDYLWNIITLNVIFSCGWKGKWLDCRNQLMDTEFCKHVCVSEWLWSVLILWIDTT
jgi:hypothetical protein